MKITKTMGSICSNLAKDIKPPSDLSELLQQTEKSGLPTPWLSEFQKYCSDLDTSTKLEWRARLLEFVLESRTIIKLSKGTVIMEKEKEETLKNLMYQLEDRFFPEEGGIALSDSGLRQRLISDLKTLRGDMKGAQGVKEVLSGPNVTVTSLASTIQEVYLDPSVWDKLERLYLQYLKKNPSLQPLAVILSIL